MFAFVCKILEFLFLLFFFFLLVCEYKGAGYSDVNEVLHIELQRSINGCLKWWMLLYEMHSIGN